MSNYGTAVSLIICYIITMNFRFINREIQEEGLNKGFTTNVGGRIDESLNLFSEVDLSSLCLQRPAQTRTVPARIG
jgi:hypothetical protein